MGVILRLEDYLTAARKVIKSPVSATNRTLESLWFVVTEAEIVKKNVTTRKRQLFSSLPELLYTVHRSWATGDSISWSWKGDRLESWNRNFAQTREHLDLKKTKKNNNKQTGRVPRRLKGTFIFQRLANLLTWSDNFIYCRVWFSFSTGNLFSAITCCPIKWMLVHAARVLGRVSQNAI